MSNSQIQSEINNSPQEPATDAECYFIPGLKANGKPYSYYMHKHMGISGGTGPMGSIESKTITISIPRSRAAQYTHRKGFIIKLSSFLMAVYILSPVILPEKGFISKITISACLLLTGGLLCMLVYQLDKTRSKFFFAGSYPLVKEFKKRGYKRGSHPMVSTTPVGLLSWLLRLLF